jgi:hypothetical protein
LSLKHPEFNADGVDRDTDMLKRLQESSGSHRKRCFAGFKQLWNRAKRWCRKPGHKALRLLSAGIWKPGESVSQLRNKCHWYLRTAPDIVSDILSNIIPDIMYMTFNIECEIVTGVLQQELPYQSFLFPILMFDNFDIGDIRYH